MNYKIAVIYYKKGDMRFISHLDLIRLFQRAIRRTEMDITITKGYNPRPKISFGQALKLGLESDNEQASFYFDVAVSPRELKERLNRELPEGIRITDAKTDTN